MSDASLKDAVRDAYGRAALRVAAGAAPDCCRGADCSAVEGNLYDPADLATLPDQAVLGSLGCGNPTALAELRAGDTVLDLGSGGGLDVLLSARRVAPGGMAYGLDMTDEMLTLANRNQEKAGVTNATFLKGTIELVPLPEGTVDVVISNCVINLAEDKGSVIREAFRVLKPGGRLAVSDMVELEAFDADAKKALDMWAGCISGTIPVDRYRAALVQAGFEQVDFDVHSTQRIPGVEGLVGSAYIRARKPEA